MTYCEKYLEVILEKEKEYNVRNPIQDEGFISKFLFENPSFKCKEDAINYYFMDAEKSAKKLYRLVNDLCGFENEKISGLEYASGCSGLIEPGTFMRDNSSLTLSCSIWVKKEVKNLIPKNSKKKRWHC